MSIPRLKDPLEVLNNVDFDEPFEFYLADETDPDDFTNCVIRAGLVNFEDPSKSVVMTSEDDTVLVTDAANGKFQMNVDALVMWALPGGTYDFDIIVIRESGREEPLLKGKVKLVQGATPPS